MSFFSWLKSGPSSADPVGDPSPDEVTVANAYKTRWVWYHTILALEILMTNVLLAAIVVILAVKL